MKEYFRTKRWWIIALVVVLAAVLRLHHLGARDFWYDEAFTSVALQESYPAMFRLLVQDVHPPLPFVFMKMITDIFGSSVFMTRLVPTLFGIASVYATFLFTKELVSKRAGVFAAFLAAICPFLVQYSQEARMYSQYGFFVMLAAYFLVRILKYHELRDSVFFGIAVALGALTHYMSLLYIGLFYLVTLLWTHPFSDILQKNIYARINAIAEWLIPKRFFAGLLVATGLCLVWVPQFLEQYANKQDKTKWIPAATLQDIPRTLWMFIIGTPAGELGGGIPYPHVLIGVPEGVGIAISALVLAGVTLALLRKRFKEGLTLFVLSFGFMGGIFLLSLLGKHYFLPRYMLPVALFLAALVGSWLASLRRTQALAAVFVYVCATFLIVPTSPSTGYNELKANLDRYEGFHFYSLNSFDYLIAKAYFGEDRLRLYNVGWPQYDSRSWPGIGPGTKRVEELNILKQDPQGLILWNVEFPLTQRDDRLFPADQFTLIERYHDLAIYAPKRENGKIGPR